jgi:serine/threonine protein kinase
MQGGRHDDEKPADLAALPVSRAELRQPAPQERVLDLPYGIPVQRRETRAFTLRLRDGALIRKIFYQDDETLGRCEWNGAFASDHGDTGPDVDGELACAPQVAIDERTDPVLVITRTDSGMRLVDPLTGEATWNVTYADYDMYLLDDQSTYIGDSLYPLLPGGRSGIDRMPPRTRGSASESRHRGRDAMDARDGSRHNPGIYHTNARYEAILMQDARLVVVRDVEKGTTMWTAEFPHPIMSLRAIGDVALVPDAIVSTPAGLSDGRSTPTEPVQRHFWQWSRKALPRAHGADATTHRPDEWYQMCPPPFQELYRKEGDGQQNAYGSFASSAYDSAPVQGGVLLTAALFVAGLGPLATVLAFWTIWRMRHTERRRDSHDPIDMSPLPRLRRRRRARLTDALLKSPLSRDFAPATDNSLKPTTAQLTSSPVQRSERPRSATDSATSSESVLPSGHTRVGRLLISPNVIGLGSHGTTVYEGLLLPGYRRVAIKRLLKSFYHIARREIEVLIELDESCRHILRYYAMEESGDFIYIALELCAGSLQDRIERGELPATRCPSLDELATDVGRRAAGALQLGPPVTTVRALRGLLLGIAELHEHGIVHRDLKPANILLAIGTDDAVKIADVGLAKRLDAGRGSFTAGTTAVGSVGWRPPEVLRSASLSDSANGSHVSNLDSNRGPSQSQADGQSPAADAAAAESARMRLTRAVDVFSVGCIAFYLLTMGNHPFGELVFQRDANILAGVADLSALRAWPEAFDLVRLAIQFEPEQRPPASALLGHPFFWNDARKLQFLIDVSDALFERPESRHLRYEIERGCESNVLGPKGNWSLRIDTSVLLSLRGRSYNGSSVVDLLRLARNKRTHYYQQPDDVKALLGPIPVDDDPKESRGGTETAEGDSGMSHNLYTYFAQRFPNLFMHVYEFAIRSGLALSEHFQRYPSRELVPYYGRNGGMLSLATVTRADYSRANMLDASTDESLSLSSGAFESKSPSLKQAEDPLSTSNVFPERRHYSRDLFNKVRQDIGEDSSIIEELGESFLQLTGPHPLRRRSCEFFLASTVTKKPEHDADDNLAPTLMRLPPLLARVAPTAPYSTG